MTPFCTWLPSRRLLQQNLARLVDTLEALVQRLRDSISRTVGEAVANAVHEVTHRLTASHAPLRHGHPRPRRSGAMGRPLQRFGVARGTRLRFAGITAGTMQPQRVPLLRRRRGGIAP